MTILRMGLHCRAHVFHISYNGITVELSTKSAWGDNWILLAESVIINLDKIW